MTTLGCLHVWYGRVQHVQPEIHVQFWCVDLDVNERWICSALCRGSDRGAQQLTREKSCRDAPLARQVQVLLPTENCAHTFYIHVMSTHTNEDDKSNGAPSVRQHHPSESNGTGTHSPRPTTACSSSGPGANASPSSTARRQPTAPQERLPQQT